MKIKRCKSAIAAISGVMRSAQTYLCCAIASVTLCSTSEAQVQRQQLPATVPLLSETQPPGVVGSIQLQRQPQLRGYYQPVEFRGPAGMQVSFASGGVFTEPMEQPVRAALLVGVPYRIKVTGIPFEPETELFPTIELIDRTYPPVERAHRFPVPIEFDAIDFESAMRGDLVTRVVYLEDSQNAEPVSYANAPQRVFEATPGEDMLMTADIFGRGLAIVRLGSRVPSTTDGFADEHFLFGCPPVVPIKAIPNPEELYEQGIFQRYENAPSPESTTDRSASRGRIGDSH